MGYAFSVPVFFGLEHVENVLHVHVQQADDGRMVDGRMGNPSYVIDG